MQQMLQIKALCYHWLNIKQTYCVGIKYKVVHTLILRRKDKYNFKVETFIVELQYIAC